MRSKSKWKTNDGGVVVIHRDYYIKTTFEKIPPEEIAIKAIFVAFMSISGLKQAKISEKHHFLYVMHPVPYTCQGLSIGRTFRDVLF